MPSSSRARNRAGAGTDEPTPSTANRCVFHPTPRVRRMILPCVRRPAGLSGSRGRPHASVCWRSVGSSPIRSEFGSLRSVFGGARRVASSMKRIRGFDDPGRAVRRLSGALVSYGDDAVARGTTAGCETSPVMTGSIRWRSAATSTPPPNVKRCRLILAADTAHTLESGASGTWQRMRTK